jgi:pimeloyl-ACP methyl ester carboxylesterase
MPREQSISVEGLRIRYLEDGAGAAVLLLHGASLGSSADVWSDNMPEFARLGLHTIAPDLPGFGASDKPGDASLGFRIRFVPQFMATLGLQRAHIVGHSQSGRIAVTLALDQPKIVSKIVVLGTGSLLPPLEPGGEALEREALGEKEPTLAETRAQLESAVFHRERVAESAVWLRHRLSTGSNFAAAHARRAAKGGDEKAATPLWQRLAEVTVPMRLIYGRQDRDAEKRAALARELHPALDLHLVDRCGHIIQWDAPEELSHLAGAFLVS